MKIIILVGLGLFLGGCSSPRGYRALPAKYTELNWSPGMESYLVELIPAFTEGYAKRFDVFWVAGRTVVEVRKVHRNGLGGPKIISGDVADTLLSELRGFDWSHPADSDDPRAQIIAVDDPVLVFKMRSGSLYREVRVGASDSEKLWDLFRKLAAMLEEERQSLKQLYRSNRPNQSMEPTATAVTPRADARVAPAAAVAHH